jgi:26S proteasome regulatory subunit N5
VRIIADIFSDLLKCFVTKELMRWPGIEEMYGPTLRQSPVFASSSELGKKTGTKTEGKKPEEIENPGEWRWEQLHKRVVEHVSCPAPRTEKSKLI